MTRAVAYLRVSTSDQAETGFSLAAQRERIEAYAKLYGLSLVAVIEDAGASAKTLARDGLQRALEMLRSGEAEAMVVSNLDRLTRSVRDLGQLVDGVFQTAALLSVAEQVDTRTAGGRLVLNVLGSVSQWEREAIGERTRNVLRSKKARGERVGQIPYGSRLASDGTRLEPVPSERLIIETAKTLRARGLSLRAVANALAEAGFRSRTGKVFAAQQVKRMVAA